MTTRCAPASIAFSTSSLTTEAGRSTTSPAAIWFARSAGRRLIFPTLHPAHSRSERGRGRQHVAQPLFERARGVQKPGQRVPDVAKPDGHFVADLDHLTIGDAADRLGFAREPLRPVERLPSRLEHLANKTWRRPLEHAFLKALRTGL